MEHQIDLEKTKDKIVKELDRGRSLNRLKDIKDDLREKINTIIEGTIVIPKGAGEFYSDLFFKWIVNEQPPQEILEMKEIIMRTRYPIQNRDG